MNLPLKQDVKDWVARQVSSGRYASEADAIDEALREKIENEAADRILSRIEESEQQYERGEFAVADDAFFDRLRERIIQARAKGS
ncbi:ribbon-helix-helix domain-containing protein [Mesorhizobium xinjiangense]|uniref:ribbon-helix-helix domain-containing protein n=1 Tax=Mesorhizobium xinjiangense TaxID=2678685 RepID=UPI0012ED9DFD|nr:hypothetical protein [Mesorhizobium xinjiangense]